MKIDAHQHFWNPARGDYYWMDSEGAKSIRRTIMPKDLAPHLRALGIDKTVLVQAAPSVAETDYMLGIADATDFVAKVVGWIDFENRDDIKALGALEKASKVCGRQADDSRLARPRMDAPERCAMGLRCHHGFGFDL